jgi:hypothetical protein
VRLPILCGGVDELAVVVHAVERDDHDLGVRCLPLTHAQHVAVVRLPVALIDELRRRWTWARREALRDAGGQR